MDDEKIIAKHLNNLQNISNPKQKWISVKRSCIYADTAILSRLNVGN